MKSVLTDADRRAIDPEYANALAAAPDDQARERIRIEYCARFFPAIRRFSKPSAPTHTVDKSAVVQPPPQDATEISTMNSPSPQFRNLTAIEHHLAQPAPRAFWEVAAKVAANLTPNLSSTERAALGRSIGTGDSGIGQYSVPTAVSTDFLDIVALYGAFRNFHVVRLDSGKFQTIALSGYASTEVLKPSSQGSSITADSGITAASLTPECRTIAALVPVSLEVLQDGAGLEAALLRALAGGLAYRLDFLATVADGGDDKVDGDMTGVFADASVTAVNAAAGNTTVAELERADFCNAVAAVRSSALQRDPAWLINPAFQPQLLRLSDAGGPLLTPPTSRGDSWRLVGHPVAWCATAPSTNSAGSQVAAFGDLQSILVAIRQDLEISFSDEARFNSHTRLVRMIARAWAQIEDATGVATLKLAAS